MLHPAIKKPLRRVLLIFWLFLISGTLWAWWQSGIALTDIPYQLDTWLRQFGLWQAALCYIVFYALRPLVFFPASLLTITSGLLFGPWLGILFTIGGENASANVAFLISRWFGREWVEQRESANIQKWDTRLRENGLVTVLLLRLLYLPFDAVNYGCGLTSMRHRDFFLGTLIGILPSLIGFVLLGGAVHATEPRPFFIFGLSVGFIVLGLLLARLLKMYQKT